MGLSTHHCIDGCKSRTTANCVRKGHQAFCAHPKCQKIGKTFTCKYGCTFHPYNTGWNRIHRPGWTGPTDNPEPEPGWDDESEPEPETEGPKIEAPVKKQKGRKTAKGKKKLY